MKKLWTFRYTMINILYFSAFCTIHAYADVFLIDKGFSNTQIGIALAVANILSVIGQPLIAGIIDKGRNLTNRSVVMGASAILLAGSVSLLLISSFKPFIFVMYLLMYTIQFIYQPMMIAMNYEYGKAGCKINFGLARGMGSAGFAVTSAFLGGAVENYGKNVILYVTIAVMALMVAVVYFFKKPDCACENKDKYTAGKSGFITFVKKYPMFMLFLLGAACCFFAHNMINDFMIQIIRSLGGNETQLGYATFLQAILELPVMALMGLVLKKISVRSMLVFSAVSFLVKTAILYFSSGMSGMYVSQMFQMFAYAVFIPASTHFSERLMAENDKVKGQAYINCAITLGGVFSNALCGGILDGYGVKSMLLTGIAVCSAGVVISAFSIFKCRDGLKRNDIRGTESGK